MVDAKAVAVVLAADVNGLGAVRSLHLKRVPTIAVVRKAGDVVLYSRLPRKAFLVQEENVPGEKLVRFLMDLECGQSPVLIATSDVFMEFLVAYQGRLREKFRFVIPDDEVVATLIDKKTETERLGRAGIPLPRTVTSLDKEPENWFEELRFPIIVKPRAAKWVGKLRAKNRLLYDIDEARAFSKEFAESLEFLLAQEVIPGDDANQWVCNCVFGLDSSLLSCFTFQRLRLSPAHYGVTSFAISRRNSDVEAIVRKIGAELAYVGPAMIEFKWDDRDGEYKYLETNPRLGMCNWFDTSCGVENVHITYRLSIGDVVQKMSLPQREGIVFISLFADLYARRKDGERLLSVVRQYAGYAGSRWVSAFWIWWDPLPCGVTWMGKFSEVGRSVLRKLGR